MRIMKRSVVRVVLVVAAAVAAAAWLPRVVAFREPPDPVREIRIVARDMTFYVDGNQTPNPTLRVRAGEQIRVVLRNEDPGMTHDFSVTAWDLATKTLTHKGEWDAVVFHVPAQRGTIAYQCTPHSELMKGTITIE